MDSAAPDTGPKPPESDVLVCLAAAMAGALHGKFQPRTFLAELSTALQPFVPHDRLGIGYLSDDGRTFSVFAEHGGPGFLPPTDRYTTDLRGAARFPVAASPLAPVFEGEALCVADFLADPRFADHAAELKSTGLKSTIFVPLLSGSRVIGKLSAATRVAAVYGDVHVERLRRIGRMIGPFIEAIALLYRERRRRHRMELLAGITKMLGTTLDLREILASLGDAVRPAIAFDAMGVIILDTSGEQWAFFGTAGEPPARGIERIPTREFSYGPALMAGRTILFDEASREVNLAFP